MKEEYKDVMFGYKIIPAFGRPGMKNWGFGVFIYPDGKLKHEIYASYYEKRKEKRYEISKAAVEKIKEIIDCYDQEIREFDDHLDNGTLDGAKNIFIYEGNEYITWNIKHCEIDKVKEYNPSYYKKYLPVMIQENKMLEIFNQICEVLSDQGIILNLYNVKTKKINTTHTN